MRFYLYMNDWLCKDKKIFAMTLFDYKYIDLYKEYEQMRRQGDKVTYCVAVLSIRHGVCERKIYEIVGRFKKECTFHAV